MRLGGMIGGRAGQAPAAFSITHIFAPQVNICSLKRLLSVGQGIVAPKARSLENIEMNISHRCKIS